MQFILQALLCSELISKAYINLLFSQRGKRSQLSSLTSSVTKLTSIDVVCTYLKNETHTHAESHHVIIGIGSVTQPLCLNTEQLHVSHMYRISTAHTGVMGVYCRKLVKGGA